ncbi:MAG: filamentous hemagglutinin N-terminal domain-containing protein [Alphaproteobacteria bacterium]|nr:filamentous hemagglutinin N-terminal domain-containing protein [Alphaproteobacteria bacterium]MCD8494208.1 filamentous hemagglutinin N-terminal domain-containing protein [Alphaproteobacteria bacterium]
MERISRKLWLLSSVAALLSATAPALAAPQGGVVNAGNASISQTGPKTDIYQSTGKAVIDWQSFDIAPNEHTEFHQPSSSSLTLNRIHDVKTSAIDGQLTANGHIILINPNGIVFGAGAASMSAP